ncbi:cobalamin B12-binding domain-containing protein [Thermincola ferriacetica]|uniref:Cobalamin B12-binding domain-containing protein n=1 Tax=Thermincola ferriacetica TaxID=281456 RepID=A0A0L6W2R4_9FIRM|nr:corrinoid protein [Thermincola ferriacetica]KNZ69761.1 cobalamin B12-binding domain-containing protein [Thermincola ferriacetica]
MSQLFEEIKEAVIDGDEDLAAELAQRVLDENINPVEAVKNGYIKGIEEIGNSWKAGEAFLPDVMMAADAMKAGMAVLEPAIAEMGSAEDEAAGKIVIGTVAGDIHDIGKNIVAALLTAAGFKVYDLGIDQKPENFLAKAEEVGAHIIAATALLTTTMNAQRELIEYLEAQNVRDKYKVIVGGGPTSQAWADEIKADGWAETGDEAVELCKKLLA